MWPPSHSCRFGTRRRAYLIRSGLVLARCVFALALSVCLLTPVAAFAQGQVTGGFTVGVSVSSVAVSSITTTTATISWTTNGNATSQVFYDTASHADVSGYAFSTAEDSSPVISHSVSLSGLTPATTYHYRVKSTTAGNLSAISGDATFVTSTAGGGGGGGGGGGFGGGGGGGGGAGPPVRASPILFLTPTATACSAWPPAPPRKMAR